MLPITKTDEYEFEDKNKKSNLVFKIHCHHCDQAFPWNSSHFKEIFPTSTSSNAILLKISPDARYETLPYTLYYVVRKKTTLLEIDSEIRKIWLDEPCGHLSRFYKIFGGEDLEFTKNIASTPIVFLYEYDFGATTHLKIEKIKPISNKFPTSANYLILGRNYSFGFKCMVKGCEHLADFNDYSMEMFVCKNHKEAILETSRFVLSNSPRNSECCYSGENQPIYRPELK
eukprot:gene5701-9521_t